MISFIIPALNEERLIAASLGALKAYAGAKEIILSDDGSTDETAHIGKQLADVVVENHSGVHGVARARNAGAKAARGEYLVFVDADILIPRPNDFFAVALRRFNEDPAVGGLSVKVRVLPELETKADYMGHSTVNLLYRVENNVAGIGVASGEFQMVRATAFQAIGGYNESLVAAEDADLFQRLAKIGKTHFEASLCVYETGRRVHTTGWLKTMTLWVLNSLSVTFRNRPVSKEWTQIR